MLDFSNYLTNPNYCGKSNKLVTGKMRDETGGIAIEVLVGLKAKIYPFLVDNNEHKKSKAVNKYVVAAVSHNKYKE